MPVDCELLPDYFLPLPLWTLPRWLSIGTLLLRALGFFYYPRTSFLGTSFFAFCSLVWLGVVGQLPLSVFLFESPSLVLALLVVNYCTLCCLASPTCAHFSLFSCTSSKGLCFVRSAPFSSLCLGSGPPMLRAPWPFCSNFFFSSRFICFRPSCEASLPGAASLQENWISRLVVRPGFRLPSCSTWRFSPHPSWLPSPALVYRPLCWRGPVGFCWLSGTSSYPGGVLFLALAYCGVLLSSLWWRLFFALCDWPIFVS